MRPGEPAWAGPLDAILEIFAIVGAGGAAALVMIAFVLRILDGPWERTLAVVETGPDGDELRWIGRDGLVHSAVLTPQERRILGDAESAEISTSTADPARFRLRRASTPVRFTLRFAGGMALLALACAAASLGLLFARG